MENKKSKLGITILVIVAVAVIVLLLLFGTKGCSSDEVVLTEDDIQQRIEECEKETDYFQAKCYQYLAADAKDPSYCDKVAEIRAEGFGDSNLYTTEAVCLGYVGSKMDYDYLLCDGVVDNQEYYDNCMGMIAKAEATDLHDPSICDDVLGLGHEWYSQCIAATVESEDELEICDVFEDDAYDKGFCLNLGYRSLSIVKEDVEYCYKITSSATQLFCVGSYADHFDDLDVCHDMESNDDMCVCYNVYFDEINEEICEGLPSLSQQEACRICMDMDLY